MCFFSVLSEFIVGDEIFERLSTANESWFAVNPDQNHRRKESSIVLAGLCERICTAVEQGEDLAGLDVGGQHSVVGQAALALDIKIDISAVAQRAGDLVGVLCGSPAALADIRW